VRTLLHLAVIPVGVIFLIALVLAFAHPVEILRHIIPNLAENHPGHINPPSDAVKLTGGDYEYDDL
jgi:hypothetical protein